MEGTANVKQVFAILVKKKTYTVGGIMYRKDMPVPVDIKTARYLKFTGLFSFSKIENEE